MTDADVRRLVDLLEHRRREEAIREVVELYRRTGSVHEVVGLLAATQREVGRRWETNQWSVAQEHHATAVLDTALGVVAAENAAGPATHGEVVVTCAEGEWHVLPARMFAEQLRQEGFAVSFLGASTPAAHLQRFLVEVGPAALCVSCSVPLFLPGAARSIEAGHAAGIPVLAGGAAFGPDDRRATALGAAAWAPDARTAARLLRGGMTMGGAFDAPPGRDEAIALAARRPDLVDAALERLTSRFPPLARWSSSQIDRTKEDFGYILQYVEAAIVTGDARVVDDVIPWLSGVLVARGVPEPAIELGFEVLHDVAGSHSPAAAELLARAVMRRRP